MASCIDQNSGLGHEPFGHVPFGGGIPCTPVADEAQVPIAAVTTEAAETVALRTAIEFPFRFSVDGNVLLNQDESADLDDLKLSVFVRRKGIPLFRFGAGIEELVFEPLDFGTEVLLSDRVATSVSEGSEILQVLEDQVTFQEDEHKLSAAIPYVNLRTGKVNASLLAIPRQRTDI